MQNNIRSLPLYWMNWCLYSKVPLKLKNLCICWRKAITAKKTIRLLRNTLIPIIRLTRKANTPSWLVIIRVMACPYPDSPDFLLNRLVFLGYLDSPDPRLDQTQTYEAINQLQLYLEYYPQSERAKEAQNIMFELQEKLAYKELLAVRLYFNLGTYMGNNYLSCVITAQNALKNYPYSKYREEFMFYTIRAKYELAIVSVEEKLQGRYREVVDEYYNYMNEYPEGKYVKQVQKFYDYASKRITNTY